MVILMGLIVGRWRLLPIAAIAWSALLLADATIDFADVPLAAGLAFVNCGLGVLTHKLASILAGRLAQAS